MTKQEFAQWLEDFTRRFPDAGAWLKGRPATLQVWFDDCFASFELADCRAVNIQLMGEGALSESWNRDKIPAIFLKRVSEVRHARQKRIEAVKSKNIRTQSSNASGDVLDRSMSVCLSECRRLKAEHRKAFIDQFFDSKTPVETVEKWVDDPSWLQAPKRDTIFAEVPKENDDLREALAAARAALR